MAALLEVSLTAFPAYDDARVLAVRSALDPYLNELADLDPARSIPLSLESRELELLGLK